MILTHFTTTAQQPTWKVILIFFLLLENRLEGKLKYNFPSNAAPLSLSLKFLCRTVPHLVSDVPGFSLGGRPSPSSGIPIRQILSLSSRFPLRQIFAALLFCCWPSKQTRSKKKKKKNPGFHSLKINGWLSSATKHRQRQIFVCFVAAGRPSLLH
jgi:hypothetical protein